MTEIAENTPIYVSIASSGIPRPEQTAPVVVWKLSVKGYRPVSISIELELASSTSMRF